MFDEDTAHRAVYRLPKRGVVPEYDAATDLLLAMVRSDLDALVAEVRRVGNEYGAETASLVGAFADHMAEAPESMTRERLAAILSYAAVKLVEAERYIPADTHWRLRDGE